MELRGAIKLINEAQVISEKFTKRSLILETNETYPQVVEIEFVNDKTSILNNFKVGDKVTVGINVRGREWVNPKGETKYFTSINGWKISEGTEISSEEQNADRNLDWL